MIEKLEKEIEDMEDILSSKNRIKKIIISELEDVIKKYSKPRCSEIIYSSQVEEVEVTEDVPDYPVR